VRRTLLALAALPSLAAPAAALTPADVEEGALRAQRGLKPLVKQLAANRLAGRDNGSRGSGIAGRILRRKLANIGEGLAPGPDPYAQPFELGGNAGTNFLARIPGREFPDQAVVVGAHYDHLAPGTCAPEPGDFRDRICNGAADNATGAAVALAVGKAIAKLPEAPRRSVVVALWDAEEEGLFGSAHYVAMPPVPLAQTLAYVNLDVLGTVQLPAIRANTLVLAAETGGPVLRGAVADAFGVHALTASFLSYAIGEARSDYASFGGAGVPTVFFTDGPYRCYHNAGDEARRIDYEKLAEQSAIVFRTVLALAEGEDAPVFAAPALAPVYDDAAALDAILDVTVPAHLDLFAPAAQAEILFAADRLAAIVADGPGAFDAADATATRIESATIGIQVIDLGCPALAR
jgi:hypothetical protein